LIFFFFFILTLVKHLRSRRQYVVKQALHCTSGQQALLKLIRGFDCRIFWLLSFLFIIVTAFMVCFEEEAISIVGPA